MEVAGEGGGGHVEIALHEELAAIEGRVGAVAVEGLKALEGGEEVGEEGLEEGVVGPVRG